jgi:adenylate cyclase
MKKFLTNRWLHTIILLVLLVGALFVRIQDYDWTKSLRYLAFDAYNQMHPRPQTDNVVIVDLDEASLRDDRLGQWPWPRTTVATLVDNLKEMGASAIVFDMVFAEEDRTSPAVLLKRLPEDSLTPEISDKLSKLPDHDYVLADAFARAGNVVTGFVWSTTSEATRHNPHLSRPIIFGKGTQPLQVQVPSMRGVTTNLNILEKTAAGNGSFGVSAEIDGIIRQVPMFFRQNGPDGELINVYPSLAIEALRVSQDPRLAHKIRVLKDEEITPFAPDMLLNIGKYTIPMGADGKFYVHFSKSRADQYIPAWTVVDKSADPIKIKDKIVLIGTSAEGLKDIRSTPLDLFIPGVELHLNIIEQIQQGRFLLRPALMQGAELLFTLGVGMLVIVIAPFVNAVLLSLITLSMMAGLAFVSLHAFNAEGLLIDPVYPALTIFAISVVAALMSYMRAEMERRAVKQAFGLYISPDYMKELADNPDQLRLGGELRDITTMFTDIRGFTSISEQLKPDELIHLMNDFLTPMSDLVMANRGTIDKYMGDAMMAFWNAPLLDPNHARNACIAALSMNKALEPINARLVIKGGELGKVPIQLKAGIGINSGPGAVGNMGSKQRFAYSVLGDAVNLASRLESQTKAYGVDILLGENTYQEITDFAALELDLIRVKGKQVPVRIYTLLGGHEDAKQSEFHILKLAHDEMLALYRSRDFTQASDRLNDCLSHAPASIHGYYAMMKLRMNELQKTPPESSWDGVFEAQYK